MACTQSPQGVSQEEEVKPQDAVVARVDVAEVEVAEVEQHRSRQLGTRSLHKSRHSSRLRKPDQAV